MNKNIGSILRIVLGGYLIWLGISICLQVVNERPSNMVFICFVSAFFILTGSGYAIYCLLKMTGVRFRFPFPRKREAFDCLETNLIPRTLESKEEGSAQKKESEASVKDEGSQETNPFPEAVQEVPQASEEDGSEEKAAVSGKAVQQEPETPGEMREEENAEKSHTAFLLRDRESGHGDVQILEFPDTEQTQEEEDVETDYEEK